MSAADVVVVVAACIGCIGAIVSLTAAWILVGQVRRLERGIEALRHEAVPLVEEARAAAGHAASEIARVDAVLADTESVTATVDHATRVVRRAFANPVVKVLAWRAGAATGLRRLQRGDSATTARTAIGARHGDAGVPRRTATDVVGPQGPQGTQGMQGTRLPSRRRPSRRALSGRQR